MVSIILVNWNTPELTLSCLRSLLRLAGPQPQIIICDNHSEEGSYDLLRRALPGLLTPPRDDWQTFRWRDLSATPSASAGTSEQQAQGPEIVLMRTPHNLGFAGGVNRCLRWALQNPAMAYAWILNNDTVVDEQALVTLLDAMQQEPDVALCGSTLLYGEPPPARIQAAGGTYNAWLGITRHLLAHREYSPELCRSIGADQFDYIVGGSLLFRRAVLEQVGLLSEDYFLYFEELDWVRRMRRRLPGQRLGYAPDSLVYHRAGASTGVNEQAGKTYRYASDYFYQTSRLRFARRYYPWRYWLVRVTLLGVAVNRLRRRQWRSAGMALGLLVGWLPGRMRPPGRVA